MKGFFSFSKWLYSAIALFALEVCLILFPFLLNFQVLFLRGWPVQRSPSRFSSWSSEILVQLWLSGLEHHLSLTQVMVRVQSPPWRLFPLSSSWLTTKVSPCGFSSWGAVRSCPKVGTGRRPFRTVWQWHRSHNFFRRIRLLVRLCGLCVVR